MKAFPVLAGVTLLLAACGSAPSTATATATGTFGRIFDHPGVAVVTGGRLYVTWQANPVTAAVPRFELARVDQATGAIKATHLLSPGQVATPLAAGGWLWVPIATPAGESVLRLNPVDLTQAGQVPVGSGSYPAVSRGSHLAVAGGALWIAGGDRLLRVSLATGQVVATITLPGAYSSDVAANGTGTVLVVSEANYGGIGSLQRRDPVTGVLLTSHPMNGVIAPELTGVIDSGVWVSQPTGMLGYVERFPIATLMPDTATDVSGTNGISAAVADGVVWMTNFVGGTRRNYCADPITGRKLATIPLPDPSRDVLLAISSRYLYYYAPAGNGYYLERLAVPPACR